MSRLFVEESTARELTLDREERACPGCGTKMHVRCQRQRNIVTLEGPVRLSVKLLQCREDLCGRKKLHGSEQEASFAMPRWGIGWDVFCWIGQRRFLRHWSVPQIRTELNESYDIQISDDAIEDYIDSYQNMVAARH